MSGTSRLFRRFLSLLGPRMVSTVIAVLATPIIVRLLGPGGYGDYAVLLSMYSLYMIPISSAITEGVQKFVAESRDIRGWVEQVLQFYTVLALVLALGGATLLLGITRLGYVQMGFGEGFSQYFYVLALFVVVGQFRGLSMHTLLGFGLERVNGPLGVVKKAATVVLGISLVLSGYGVVGMLIGHIAANGLITIVAGYFILRRISLRRFLSLPTDRRYREFLSFNALNIVLVLLMMSLFHVDVVMVRTFIDNEATGFYKAALALAEYIWIVPIILQRLLLHSSSNLWSEDRMGAITELAGRITRYTTLLVLLMAIGLGTLADRFVPLYYGVEFAVATTPLLLLLPGTVGFAVARPLQAISQGSGQLTALILATATAAILNVVLNMALIPIYGINGAAIATSASYGSMFLLLIGVARHLGYDPLVDFRPGRIAVTAIVSGALIVGIDSLIAQNLLALLVVPPLGLGLFTGVMLLTGAMDIEELKDVVSRLPMVGG